MQRSFLGGYPENGNAPEKCKGAIHDNIKGIDSIELRSHHDLPLCFA